MDAVVQALDFIKNLLLAVLGVVFGVFVAIEAFVRNILLQAGLPRNIVNIALIVLAVVLLVIVARLFGGAVRALLFIFFALLLIHLLMGGLVTF